MVLPVRHVVRGFVKAMTTSANRLQTATYLLGVCLFSISFLVFLNSSVSFVITDIIRRKDGIGDAVGTLGFADELVALAACPIAGLLSDRIGVRTVATIGYGIVGVSLILFVQAENIYPQLLLGRMFFSCGGAATATMVTAILPAMIPDESPKTRIWEERPRHASSSVSSDVTITPARVRFRRPGPTPSRDSTRNRFAGLVGLFTGCGALIALSVFLPLPTWLKHQELSSADALRYAFYVVGAIALLVAGFCYVGLQGLNGEEEKGWHQIWTSSRSSSSTHSDGHFLPYWRLVLESVMAAVKDNRILLGYLGGFVARASSVGISLFVPLYVNAYFVRSGICNVETDNPVDVREQCKEAYILAAKLSGFSQLIALAAAPLFGSLSDKLSGHHLPLVISALCGIGGCIGLAVIGSPLDGGEDGSAAIYVIMALLGLSQIGAIVCSLGLLSKAVDGAVESDPGTGTLDEDEASIPSGVFPEDEPYQESAGEETTLLPSNKIKKDLKHVKGAIAGTYSLFGGAGILILTKLGGFLFDEVSPSWPFILLGIANLMLLGGASWFVFVPFLRRSSRESL